MRVVLFTGKGGVGKTTTAAATAVQAARAGIKTLVMSTDAAHSLGDALGVVLVTAAGDPDPVVEVEPGLFALQLNSAHSVRRSWRSVQDYLLTVFKGLGIDPVVADELTELPGVDEIVTLLELRTQVESGPWDLVVVDCAPTAETLRLLALPEALVWHLERLMPAQRGLLRALRPAAASATGLPLPGVQLLETLRGWHESLLEIQSILAAETTSVRLVLTPERVVIAESRRTLTSLRLYGLAVDQVVVNRVFPAADASAGDSPESDPGSTHTPWLAGWNEAQQRGLAEVRHSFDPLPIVIAPYLAGEPVGTDALAALAGARTGEIGDVLTTAPDQGMTVRPEDGGYLLTLPLPLVTAAEVDLKRRDDELLVSVADHRRVLSLPSVLRRCVVTGAVVRNATLRVRFAPDEKLWPVDGRKSVVSE
ncbi:MAG: ArsA family ATPase [Actinobacteria bacterium]|nr:ArsA family ATPase [Actinomycetota bacterium]